MHQNICKSCGGTLSRDGNYYVCKFCGSKWMIDADNDVHVIDRANAWSALRDCDFEKAAELFEYIIGKEPNNHEGYWGRALANAGIIYVTDLNENKKVPTCNNISESSFLNCKDVQKAISLAPKDIADTYKVQAEQIEAIRIEWLEKASKEPAYDVFICFKDSDREHNIERTDDSYDAHNLYNALVAEGYKVFFSRVSLRHKVSEHYEPYIYNALKTAKVMIVFGEKAEYFNAVWVKNEWTRFRSRIESGEKHKNSLVVAYKDMDPADLPVGLRSRQCLNAGDITFLEDLKHHINKIVNPPQPTAPQETTAPVQAPRKKKKGLIIAAVAFVLALSITVGYVVPNYILTDSEPSETLSPTTNPDETISDENSFSIDSEITEDIEKETVSVTDSVETETIEEETEAVTDSENNLTPPVENKGSQGLEFIISDFDQTCTVAGIGSCTDTDVVIGEYYDLNGVLYKVVGIGDKAFDFCTSFTSIEIPGSVTSIGVSAFYKCTNLTSITIPDSVTSIGGSAFYNCTSLKNITIPDSVTSIGSYAFYNCTSLKNITIPDSVTSIGSYALYNCTSLGKINYSGSKSEWNAIWKAETWDRNSRNCPIYCTDGVISK